MENQLISIIIPTRNRQFYAEQTIRQINGLGKDIQIIVQDNSDNDSLKDQIKDLINSNSVEYYYEATPLPFSVNYNKAALRASGRFICAIGDDDGVLPSIIDCAQWMEREGIDAIKPAKNLLYWHPGNRNKKASATVELDDYSGSYKLLNPEAGVVSLLNEGGCNYLSLDLACSYHGLVSMKTMEKVKKTTGKYYGGLTPDMYSVICLSLVPNIKFAVIDYPVTLPGVCPESGSAASVAGKHVGKLEDAPHLKYLPNYSWDSRIPKFYSVETIWAETMMKAINEMNRDELIDNYFNKFQLAQYLFTNNLKYKNEVLNTISSEEKKYVLSSFRPAEKEKWLNKTANRAYNRLFGQRKVFRHIETIEKAVDLVTGYLDSDRTSAPWSD